jgi:hypothetical protein
MMDQPPKSSQGWKLRKGREKRLPNADASTRAPRREDGRLVRATLALIFRPGSALHMTARVEAACDRSRPNGPCSPHIFADDNYNGTVNNFTAIAAWMLAPPAGEWTLGLPMTSPANRNMVCGVNN